LLDRFPDRTRAEAPLPSLECDLIDASELFAEDSFQEHRRSPAAALRHRLAPGQICPSEFLQQRNRWELRLQHLVVVEVDVRFLHLANSDFSHRCPATSA